MSKAEKEAELATFLARMAWDVAYLRAREEYPTQEDAKRAADLDESFQEAKAEEIHVVAEYRRVSNKQINLRKYAEMIKNV